jgi:hypothetical protein
MTDNTSWQALTLEAPARTEEGPIWLRMTVRGGNTGGTGTDALYWFQVVQAPSGGLIPTRRSSLIGR